MSIRCLSFRNGFGLFPNASSFGVYTSSPPEPSPAYPAAEPSPVCSSPVPAPDAPVPPPQPDEPQLGSYHTVPSGPQPHSSPGRLLKNALRLPHQSFANDLLHSHTFFESLIDVVAVAVLLPHRAHVGVAHAGVRPAHALCRVVEACALVVTRLRNWTAPSGRLSRFRQTSTSGSGSGSGCKNRCAQPWGSSRSRSSSRFSRRSFTRGPDSHSCGPVYFPGRARALHRLDPRSHPRCLYRQVSI